MELQSTMDYLEVEQATSRPSPSKYRNIPDQYHTPDFAEEELTSVPIAGDLETVTSSGFQSYPRSIPSGTVLSRTSSEGDEMTTKGCGGIPVDEKGGMGIIAIGMALGNPVDDRDVFSVQPQVVTTVSAPKDNEAEEQLPNGLVRTKSKKWGLFGRSKSTRVKYSDRSLGQPSLPLAATVTRTISNTVISCETLSDNVQHAPSSPPRKPLERSLTEPAKSRSERRPPVPSLEESLRTLEESPKSSICSAQASKRSPETFGREPFLNVEIPSIQMERYSVMFAGLLDRRATTPLPAHRHNTHRTLQALREDDNNNSSSFSSSNGNGSSQQEIPASIRTRCVDRGLPSPLPLRRDPPQSSSSISRSKTCSAVPRTSRGVLTDLADKHNNEQSPAPHIVRLASGRGRNPRAPLQIHKSEGGRPQLRSKFHIESPKQGTTPTRTRFELSESTEPRPSSCRQTGKNALFGMDNASSVQDHGSKVKVTNYTHTAARALQSSSPIGRGSLSDDEMGEVETEVYQDAVQISIARQVSVSRPQRSTMAPLRMHPVNGAQPVEIKSLTPRLIDSRKKALSKFQNNERVVMRRVGGV
ncbi:hypothetical protein E4U43_004777 [Claviceps pusilla]|uniref:Uncharacterized protein n=1 Tax=Claviceps pusilla TaxID=123648 RepID=A0A9P7SVW9_9HYPO|nr:hypothetical protein E4U43_004777 [Claviceps pusilla]